jgi:hypothetical protein
VGFIGAGIGRGATARGREMVRWGNFACGVWAGGEDFGRDGIRDVRSGLEGGMGLAADAADR